MAPPQSPVNTDERGRCPLSHPIARQWPNPDRPWYAILVPEYFWPMEWEKAGEAGVKCFKSGEAPDP